MRYEPTIHEWVAIEPVRPNKPHGVEHGDHAVGHRGAFHAATILAFTS
jgi:hypothetical protein